MCRLQDKTVKKNMFYATAILAKPGSSCRYTENISLWLFTDLASHYRSKEETPAQAEGVDLVGDSLDGFTEVCRPLEFQRSSITWGGRQKDIFLGWRGESFLSSSSRLDPGFVCFRFDLKMAWTHCRRCCDCTWRRGRCPCPCRHRREQSSVSDTVKRSHQVFQKCCWRDSNQLWCETNSAKPQCAAPAKPDVATQLRDQRYNSRVVLGA